MSARVEFTIEPDEREILVPALEDRVEVIGELRRCHGDPDLRADDLAICEALLWVLRRDSPYLVVTLRDWICGLLEDMRFIHRSSMRHGGRVPWWIGEGARDAAVDRRKTYNDDMLDVINVCDRLLARVEDSADA